MIFKLTNVLVGQMILSIMSTLPKSSIDLMSHLGTVPRAPITTGIMAVSTLWILFTSSNARSWYFSTFQSDHIEVHASCTIPNVLFWQHCHVVFCTVSVPAWDNKIQSSEIIKTTVRNGVVPIATSYLKLFLKTIW